LCQASCHAQANASISAGNHRDAAFQIEKSHVSSIGWQLSCFKALRLSSRSSGGQGRAEQAPAWLVLAPFDALLQQLVGIPQNSGGDLRWRVAAISSLQYGAPHPEAPTRQQAIDVWLAPRPLKRGRIEKSPVH
jgi:hypothetical protein